MDLKQIVLYLCVCGVVCYPSKPLNDRPSELAWQAWLLVDAQNPNESDRRITPKSVFIAPNIGGGDNGSGSALPECAEGYRSDPMGRCIKFVKVDEAAHLDFLLQRLNAMYATKSTQELDDETKPTTGPLQVNIPLGGNFPTLEDQKDPEIAIVVAPTNGNFDVDDKKFDKRTQNDKKEEVESITTKEETTIITTESTTTDNTDDLQALFFLLPMNKTDHVQNNRTAADISKQDTPATLTTSLQEHTNIEIDADDTDNSTPMVDDTQEKGKPNLDTTFMDEDAVEVQPDIPDRFVRFPSNRDPATTIRFPENTESTENINNHESFKLPEAHRLSSSEIEQMFKEYISRKPDLAALTEQIRRRPIAEASYGGDIIQPQLQRPQQFFNPIYNHRNRDKSDLWRPAATHGEDPSQKPLVLRFNRHPYSQEQTSGEQQHQARYYEDTHRDEFAQVFGRKRRRGNLR